MPTPATDAFFDTNVIVYLLSGDAAKADRAEELLAGGGHISVQVLNEFAAVARRKLGLTWAETKDILAQVRAVCRVESVTLDMHDRAIRISERFGYSIYDSLIIAAAIVAGCDALYTEDMQDGQVIDQQLTIKNPFMPS